ncbi:hypothetical protein KY284_030274 [Solanum tuberosum]|nr:hypothetical protein KY284_030274 [Solanum tuberosum]
MVGGGSPRGSDETLARGRGRARDKGQARGISLVGICAHEVAPARGRGREASPEPQVEETLLRMLGVMEKFSQGGATGTPHGSQIGLGVQTPR